MKHPLLLTVLFVFSLLLGFYWPVLAEQKTFYYRDNTLFFEPLCRFISQSFAHGFSSWNLWNPLSYCGMSQVAIPSPGLFYPPNWLLGFFSYSTTVAIEMILHQLILAVGIFLSLRTYNLVPQSAALASVAVAMCGYHFSLESNYTMVASIAWFPLAFFAFRKLEHGHGWAFLLASGCIFMTVTAGRPEMMAPGLVLLGLKPTVELVLYAKNRQGNLITIGAQFVALAVGLLLAAPCILPALEWLQLSRRSEGLGPDEVFLFSASWYDLLGLICPQPLGDFCLRGSPFLPLIVSGRMAPYVPSAFIGPFVAALSLIGFCDQNWKYRWYWAGAILALTLFCLGENTFVAPAMLTMFPAISLLRFPSKFLIFLAMAIAVTAAYGVHVLITKKDVNVNPAMYLWICLSSLELFLFLPGFENVFDQSLPLELRQAGVKAIASATLLSGLAGLGVTLAAKLLKNSSGTKLSTLSLATTIATGVWLTFAAISNQQHLGPPDYFEKSSSLAARIKEVREKSPPPPLPYVHAAKTSHASGQYRSSTLFFEAFTCPPELQRGTPAQNTVAWYAYARQMLYPASNIDSDIASTFGYESSMKGEYFKAYLEAYLSSSQCRNPESTADDTRLLSLLQSASCDTLVTQIYRFADRGRMEEIRRLDATKFRLVHEDKSNNVRLYTLPTLPRMFLSDKWIWRNSQTVASSNQQFAPVILDIPKDHGVEQPQANASAAADSGASTLTLVEDRSDFVSLTAKCNEGKMLVVCDQLYPGWSARIDGKEVPIFAANKFFRAVYVPTGEHQIQFLYAPDSLKKGFFLLAAGVVLAMGLGIYITPGRVRKRSESLP